MITILTGNTKKYTQIASVLNEVVSTQQKNVDLEEIQTADLKIISADKARKAFEIVKGPVLVDDSGIVFDEYTGFPGALTKFLYEGVGMQGIKRMFVNVENTQAQFLCVLSYMDDTLQSPLQFIGSCVGEITFDWLDQGNENPKLPYDLIFKPEEMDVPAFFDMQTWSGSISHRYKASVLARDWLRNRGK